MNVTSNHHPDKVIYNVLVGTQSQKISTANEKDSERNDETFTKLYRPIKKPPIKYPHFIWIDRKSQCLLRSTSRENWWLSDLWHKMLEEGNSGLFLDNESNFNIKIHNFRSSTIEEVNNYLRRRWNKCLETINTLTPAFKIKILSEEWKTERLTTLRYFNNKFQKEGQTDWWLFNE